MKTRITAKIARREGVNLDGREKIDRILLRRPFAPGAHGPTSRTRQTDYGKQLREKQKAKRMYGLTEKQFVNVFKEVTKKKGDTGRMLVLVLESRLDNAVYRAGFAKTRAAARQLVNHAHFNVNGTKVDIPSFRTKSGDVISVRDNKRNKGPWKTLLDTLKNHTAQSWLSVDTAAMTCKITGAPTDEEIKKQPFDSKLIVEFYSR